MYLLLRLQKGLERTLFLNMTTRKLSNFEQTDLVVECIVTRRQRKSPQCVCSPPLSEGLSLAFYISVRINASCWGTTGIVLARCCLLVLISNFVNKPGYSQRCAKVRGHHTLLIHDSRDKCRIIESQEHYTHGSLARSNWPAAKNKFTYLSSHKTLSFAVDKTNLMVGSLHII